MPQADDDVTVLVCDCGKRLRAPGARPGRVGMCPACGGTLRFPGDPGPQSEAPRDPPRKSEAKRPEPTKPDRPKRAATAIPVGASEASVSAAGESANPERAKPIDVDRRQELLDAARQVGRGGILRLPRKSTFGLKDALLYPIWDFPGIAWMMFLPIGVGGPFLGVFYLIPLVLQGGPNALFLPFAFPMLIFFALGLGYLGQIFAAVVLDSAVGEVHHPKWPEIEFGAIIASLFRWACGLVIGLSLGAMPAVEYWHRSEEHGLGDRVVASALLATGLLYGLMSMASLILHGEMLALNPFMVVKGIFRAGVRYLLPVTLGVVVAAVAPLLLELVDRVSGSILLLPATFVLWAFLIYGGLAVSRSLGMVCHSRRDRIGWFPDRPRWGASTDGIDPSLFRDKEGRKVS